MNSEKAPGEAILKGVNRIGFGPGRPFKESRREMARGKAAEDGRSPGRYRDYPRVGLRDSVMDCG